MIHLDGGNGFSIAVLPFGASWASCRVPMPDGSVREVLLGCETEDDYRNHTTYLGAMIGRFANRLKLGRFSIDGREYVVDRNDGEHCLHGGFAGFGQRDWAIEELGTDRVRFSTVSSDGDGGFPGQMTAEATYILNSQDSSVTIKFLAAVDRPCPVSLTSHAYFNLDGDGHDSRGHSLKLSSERFLPIDKNGIPSGEILDVSGSPFDFRQRVPLLGASATNAQLALNNGYNHAFVLAADCRDMRQSAAELVSADRLLIMRMFTTLPALHVYGGNYLAGTPARRGGAYQDYAGIALEAEYPPDAPNHPEWPTPSCILYPGSIYRHCIRFCFEARQDVNPA